MTSAPTLLGYLATNNMAFWQWILIGLTVVAMLLILLAVLYALTRFVVWAARR